MLLRTTVLGLALLMLAGAVGCGGGSESEDLSIRNMEELAGAIWEYREALEKYPDKIDEEEMQKLVGGSEDFARIMVNPITGDNPGYEYVKPPEDTPLTADPIVIYQLRGGQRDTRLKAFALDGTPRSAEP